MNGGRAKLSCIEVPALPDGPWGVTFAHGRARGGPFQRGFDCAMLARPHNLRHGLWILHTDLPRDVVVSGQKNRVVVRPNARGWRREGFLGGDGGVPRFASRTHVRQRTCGKVRVQLGQAGKLGKESEARSESSESDPSTVRWASSQSRGDGQGGVFAVPYTLDTL